MIHTSFRLFFAALALLSLTSLASAQTVQRGTVSARSVNVREGPSTTARAVASLPQGTPITVLETRGVWVRVSADRVTGWIRSDLLALDAPTPAVKPPLADTTVKVNTAQPPAPTRQDSTPAQPPAPTPSPAPERSDASRDTSAGRGLTFGLLGSVTTLPELPKGPDNRHIAALPLLLIQGRTLGLYLAPEVGQGSEYRSLLLGGGLTLKLISVGRLEARAMGGYAFYGERSWPDSGASFPQWTMHAVSGGGLVSLRLLGTLRVAYRGQYVYGVGTNASTFYRHSAGLLF